MLVVDADPLLRGLLEEWLSDGGCVPLAGGEAGAHPDERFDLAIVDLPFPRDDGLARVRRLAAALPGTPILALSPTFFGSVACRGELARKLGVAAVLPKPLGREPLLAEVRRLLPEPQA